LQSIVGGINRKVWRFHESKSRKTIFVARTLLKFSFINNIEGVVNMDKGHSMGTHMMHTGAMSAIVEFMTEIWGLLTEEQKKKVMVMRMDIITQWMEAEMANEERMNEVKKKAIADIRKVQEMLK
jgi:hypothetical protein